MNEREQDILDQVEKIGALIVSNTAKDKKGYYWFPNPTINSNCIYGGNAGVVYFLIELYKKTKNATYLPFIINGGKRLYSNISFNQSLSFHTGSLGIAFVMYKIYEITDDNLFKTYSKQITFSSFRNNLKVNNFDLLNGLAGEIIGLLQLYYLHNDSSILKKIEEYTKCLVENSNFNTQGITWNRTGMTIKELCGFSHGNSGIGFVLLELANLFNNETLKWLGFQAFNYENQYYNVFIKEWPDFRKSFYDKDSYMKFVDAFKKRDIQFFINPNYMTAWCHGSPGIGLARLRSFDLFQRDEDLNYTKECIMNISNLGRVQKKLSHTILCHGYIGNAFLLIHSKNYFNDLKTDETLEAYVNYAINEVKNDYFLKGESNLDFSLFRGISGMGYFLLNTLKKRESNSMLLPYLNKTKNNYSTLNIDFDLIKTFILKSNFPNLYKVTKKRKTLKESIKIEESFKNEKITKDIYTKFIFSNENEIQCYNIDLQRNEILKNYTSFAYNLLYLLIYNDQEKLKLTENKVLYFLNENIIFINRTSSIILLLPLVTRVKEINVDIHTYKFLKSLHKPISLLSIYEEFIKYFPNSSRKDFDIKMKYYVDNYIVLFL